MTGAAPRIVWLSRDDPPDAFPPLESAFVEPDGLLAAGGDLSAERLLYAYRNGIFPWYDEGQPILWWSPDPRCIIAPSELHLARRLRRTLAKSDFFVSFNLAFDDVIARCADERAGQPGTWITEDMSRAYRKLHCDGWAHSVEVWQGETLVGGLYGLSIGKAFFGESMFSETSGGSKLALLVLCRELVKRDFEVLDCQVVSPHLSSLGATLMPRPDFANLLARACVAKTQLILPASKRRPISDFLPAVRPE